MALNPVGTGKEKIAFVGEAPNALHMRAQRPYSDTLGTLLYDQCRQAGLNAHTCYLTMAAKTPAPGHFNPNMFEKTKKKALLRGMEFYENRWVAPELTMWLDDLRDELEGIESNVVVTFGEIGLWATTRLISVSKYRGSILDSHDLGYTRRFKIIPTYSPEEIRKKYEWSYMMRRDIQRAMHECNSPAVKLPERNYIIRPSFNDTMNTLQMLIDRARAGG